MSRHWRLLVLIVATATIVLIASLSYLSRMPLPQDAAPYVMTTIPKTETAAPIETPVIGRKEAVVAQRDTSPVA